MSEFARVLDFEVTRLWFKLRDVFSAPEGRLREAGVATGAHILDYGCGPGSYTLAAAKMVGESGHIYGADIDPLAIKRIETVAKQIKLYNVTAILTSCATGLADNSIDVALLYDTYHELAEPEAVLRELHRVLKPPGVLSFSDHHLREEEAIAQVTGTKRFSLLTKGRKTYTFSVNPSR